MLRQRCRLECRYGALHISPVGRQDRGQRNRGSRKAMLRCSEGLKSSGLGERCSLKPGRLVIEHFGDFLSNTPKRLRIVFDFLRLNHLLLDRQLLRPALSALLLLWAT